MHEKHEPVGHDANSLTTAPCFQGWISPGKPYKNILTTTCNHKEMKIQLKDHN
jgi:hypothetical protein